MRFRLLIAIAICGIVRLANGSAAETIDSFVATKLNEQGIERQDEADPYTLLRRLSADLTGLPPSIEEVAGDDPSAQIERAYPQVFDDASVTHRWALSNPGAPSFPRSLLCLTGTTSGRKRSWCAGMMRADELISACSCAGSKE